MQASIDADLAGSAFNCVGLPYPEFAPTPARVGQGFEVASAMVHLNLPRSLRAALVVTARSCDLRTYFRGTGNSHLYVRASKVVCCLTVVIADEGGTSAHSLVLGLPHGAATGAQPFVACTFDLVVRDDELRIQSR